MTMELIITADLNEQDWHALQHAAESRIHTGTARRLQPWLVYFLGTLVVFAICDVLDWRFSMGSFIGGLLVALLSFLSMREQALRGMMPNKQGLFLGSCTYVLNERGLTSRHAHASSECDWASTMAVTHSATHVFIWLDTAAALCIPARYLPMRVDDLLTQIEQWRAPYHVDAAPTNKADSLPAHLSERDTPLALASWRALWHWLTWRSALVPMPPPSSTLWILAIVTLTAVIGLDYLRSTDGAVFYLDSVPVLALHVLALLALSAWLKRSTRPALTFSSALFIVLGVIPVIILLLAATLPLTNMTWLLAAYAAIALYGVGYLAQALRSATAEAQWPALFTLLVLVGLFGMLALDNDWQLSFWDAPETDTANAADLTTWERGDELLFAQSARTDAALTQVQRAPGPQPQVFFLGFAGVAEQKVFAEEIKLAAKVVAQRYHTHTQQLLLINDRRDVDSQPLATVATLRHALKGLAGKMQLDKDILFLSLSSHGLATPELQVSNGYLPLQQLHGSALKAALDDSGIKWRVVVISACHAGAFIPALKNTQTLIITAAAASKTSFGCSDDRDLTYFGEAFYRDALPGTADLKAAFDQAKAAIAVREQQEQVEASDPHAYFGVDLVNHLTQASQ